MPETTYKCNGKKICLTCFHKDKVEKLKIDLKEKDYTEAASINKVLGHPVRLELLFLISCDEICVCDLTHILEIPISTLSQHLKKLRENGLITSRMEGKFLLYSLTDKGRMHLIE